MSNYTYDVFISYSSTDVAWAEKLERDLTAKGLKVFRDETRIRLGDEWQRELIDSVHQSQHMIILWSKAAAASDWVTNERAMFFVINAQRKPTDPTRRLMAVTLEGTSAVLSQLQTFNELNIAGSYATGAASVDAVLWSDLVVKLVSAVRGDRKTLPIVTLVFTITETQLQGMNPLQPAPWGSTLEDLLKDLGVGGPQLQGFRRDLLLPYYGATRADWKPFGQARLPIRVLLDDAFTALNQRLAAQKPATPVRFHMEWVGDDFWTNPAARLNYLSAMQQNLTLLVIDVVPLCDSFQQWFFEELAQSLANEFTAVVVLPPFQTAQESARLDQFLQKAVRNFASFYNPPIPAPAKYAHFGLYANDGGEIGRLIQRSVGHYMRTEQAPAANPYLAMGK